MNLSKYSYQFTPTETTVCGNSAGDFLVYIANHLADKCRNDLNMYEKNELKSSFIEIINPKISNIIVRVIYRHPSMNLTDLNSNYLIKLSRNIFKVQKYIFLLKDFNVNLFSYIKHYSINEFLDSLASNSIMTLILQATRIISHSKTLIDKIFSNIFDPDIMSSNLSDTIFYHLLRFAIIPNMFGNTASNISNTYERDCSNFD